MGRGRGVERERGEELKNYLNEFGVFSVAFAIKTAQTHCSAMDLSSYVKATK